MAERSKITFNKKAVQEILSARIEELCMEKGMTMKEFFDTKEFDEAMEACE